MLTWLADIVLAVHVAFTLALVGGFGSIALGLALQQAWARWPWLRIAHLAAAGFIASRAWLGLPCPLTTLEMWLRGGGPAPTWADPLLFRNAAADEFSLGATLLAALSLMLFITAPPRRSPAASLQSSARPICTSASLSHRRR